MPFAFVKRILTKPSAFAACPQVYAAIKRLDWGTVTADFVNESTNTVVHVCNHELGSEAAIDRTVRFLIGRIRWFDTYLKPFRHEVKIDDRGQNIRAKQRRKIRKALADYAADVRFFSER